MAALDKKALDELMIMHRARLDEHARNEGVPNVQSGQKAHPQAALITGIARGFAPLIHELEVQIKALSARVQELEARPSLKYLGTWKEGKTYSVGTFITDGGAVWYANASTTSRPGQDADWSLAVKSASQSTARPRSDEGVAHARVNGHVSNPRPAR